MVLSVQYMRAIAALFVVVHHSIGKGAQYSSNPMGWFHIGGIGVDLFFIISGYIMCHATYKKKINFSKFIKARFMRIIPLYWVLTTVALLIFLIMPDKINSSGGITSILGSYTLVPTENSYLLQNGWTLSFEFYFYFIFALGLSSIGIVKYIKPVFIIIFVVGLGTFISFNSILAKFLTNQLVLEFVFGILIFTFFQKHTLNHLISVFFIIGSLILLLLVNFFGGIDIRVIDYGIPMLLLFIGIRGLEDAFVKRKDSMFSRLFEGIGNSSYSLYLIHPFALVAASMVFAKIGLAEYGYLFLGLLIISSLITGHACYLLLEKNLTKFFYNNPGIVIPVTWNSKSIFRR